MVGSEGGNERKEGRRPSNERQSRDESASFSSFDPFGRAPALAAINGDPFFRESQLATAAAAAAAAAVLLLLVALGPKPGGEGDLQHEATRERRLPYFPSSSPITSASSTKQIL